MILVVVFFFYFKLKIQNTSPNKVNMLHISISVTVFRVNLVITLAVIFSPTEHTSYNAQINEWVIVS